MGAGAFILATWTNIPYLEVAVAAIIPFDPLLQRTVGSYSLQAARMGIEPSENRTREPIVDRLHLLLPLAIIVVLLGMGRSPMRAAFWGVSAALWVMACVRPCNATVSQQLRDIMERAGRGACSSGSSLRCSRNRRGGASPAGIGLRMSELIITLSGGNLLAP